MRTTQSGQSALLLLDAIDILVHEQIAYAVIGAMAASVHGVLRASLDADAVMSITTQKLGALEETFKKAGFSTELRQGDYDDPIPALLAVSDTFDNRVDLLAGLRGLDAEAFVRAVDVPFHAKNLRVIGREDFIAMKVFAGSPQDMEDARRAIHVARESIDKSLLLRLTQGFGKDALRNLEKLFP